MSRSVVFLFDVDNTLLDNDGVTRDLREHLLNEVGRPAADQYWKHFESLRESLGYADYLGALQKSRNEYPHEMRLLTMSRYLVQYPFSERLVPQAAEAVAHVRQWGLPVILSDGDVVFQPIKIARAGLCDIFQDRFLIYIHKEKELADVERRYPAAHYVLIDDKPRILQAVKAAWGARVTTVHVRQGHYNSDPLPSDFRADITLQQMKDLLACTREGFLGEDR